MASIVSTSSFLCPAAAGCAARHGAILPDTLAARIPDAEARILSFILAFLRHCGVAAPLLVVGGYVRDLLLGKMPDDLDLAICLAECPADITVAALVERMPDFAVERPDLYIEQIKITTILSDEAKNKQLDTVKCHFTVKKSSDDSTSLSERIEVDIMPTIGEEIYDDDTRVPRRNERGTIDADALRRDLTIGALFLQVEQRESPKPSALVHAAKNENALSPKLLLRLMDFYGGIADLSHGVLRSPVPRKGSPELAQQMECLLSDSADAALMQNLGIVRDDASNILPEAAQIIWWIKVLRDDPLRIVRVLRFAAKLSFSLHDAFWSAIPFANHALRCKVAGNRKLTEILKISKYGAEQLQSFLALSFSRKFVMGNLDAEGQQQMSVLAPALFGGVPTMSKKTGKKGGKSGARIGAETVNHGEAGSAGGVGSDGVSTLPKVFSFDENAFRDLSAILSPHGLISPDELLGLHFVAALVCTNFGQTSEIKGNAVNLVEAVSQQFHCCCDGLSTSNTLRQAGHSTLEAIEVFCQINSDTLNPPLCEDVPFASAAGVDVVEFRVHATVWKMLQAGKKSCDWLSARANLVAAMLKKIIGDESGTRFSQQVGKSFATLNAETSCKKISGRVLSSIKILPRHMYTSFLTRLYVLVNLILGSRPEPVPSIETTDDLSSFLSKHAPHLEEDLRSIWYEESSSGAEGAEGKNGSVSQLRQAFQRPVKNKNKNKKQKI